MADPRSSTDVALVLSAWLADQFGGAVESIETPRAIGTGFTTLIHFVRFCGDRLPVSWCAPLVVRIHPTRSEAHVAQREAAIQEWCCAQGYPAPKVLALFAPGELLDLPVQVMERGPSATLLDAVKRAPWRAGRLVDHLSTLQLRLHSLPIDDWPEHGDRLAARRLRLVRGWLSAHDDPDLTAALARVEPLLPDLDAAPPVACHGDFHPLNMLVDGKTWMVIDWTDAALGDRHGDVARTYLLFQLGGALVATRPVTRAGLKAGHRWLGDRYRDRYARAVHLDPQRLRDWEAVHLVHAWAQITQAHAEARPGAARIPIELLGWVRDRFERAIA
jgi:aminoglycoside phosphotransferase (APT) family kinase protein